MISTNILTPFLLFSTQAVIVGMRPGVPRLFLLPLPPSLETRRYYIHHPYRISDDDRAFLASIRFYSILSLAFLRARSLFPSFAPYLLLLTPDVLDRLFVCLFSTRLDTALVRVLSLVYRTLRLEAFVTVLDSSVLLCLSTIDDRLFLGRYSIGVVRLVSAVMTMGLVGLLSNLVLSELFIDFKFCYPVVRTFICL